MKLFRRRTRLQILQKECETSRGRPAHAVASWTWPLPVIANCYYLKVSQRVIGLNPFRDEGLDQHDPKYGTHDAGKCGEHQGNKRHRVRLRLRHNRSPRSRSRRQVNASKDSLQPSSILHNGDQPTKLL